MKHEPDLAAPAMLAKAFMSGAVFRGPRKGKLDVERSGVLGTFHCTGRLVACDPHGIASARPFAREVRPGMWRVFAVSVKVKGSMRRAAAWVVAMKDRTQPYLAKRWEPAHLEGHADPSDASPVSIDSGTLAYCDAMSPAKYAASKPALAKLLRAMEMPVPGAPHRSSAGTVVGLLPGMGDGAYFSYWGLDEAGAPLGLLTDFGLFDSATEMLRDSFG